MSTLLSINKCSKFAHDNTIVLNFNAILLFDLQPSLSKF